MTKIAFSIVGLVLAGLLDISEAGPLSALSDMSSNAISEEQETPLVDDFTTRGLERLSSAATCLVAGVEYTHGQQIYRKDPCEFCLCLDGEMFCWWQDCPPTMEGPCKDRGPFTPCLTVPLSDYTPSSSSSSFATTQKIKANPTSSPSTAAASSESNSEYSTSSETSTEEGFTTDETPTETGTEVIKDTNRKFCNIMGRRYEIGAKLPHTTGNCVECVCDQRAKVTCSPHQCAPVGEDINDYRPPAPRQLPEVF